jgi:hypothetical protein
MGNNESFKKQFGKPYARVAFAWSCAFMSSVHHSGIRLANTHRYPNVKDEPLVKK